MAPPPKLAIKPQDQFDIPKLETMVEPLSIVVERVRGSQRSRIPLAESEDGQSPAGTGLTRENVLGFETWLVSKWSGGGSYIFNVNDSSNPPITMRWTAGYPLDKYPELIPPPLRTVVVPSAALPVAPSVPAFQVVPPMSAFPNGLPNVQTMYAVPQPSQPLAQLPHSPPMQPIYPQGWNQNAQADFDRRNLEGRIMEMEAKRFAEDKARLEREFAEKLAAERASSHSSLEGLKQMVATLTAKLESGASKSPELEAMRAENARLAAQADADRRERDADKRDQALRDAMRASEERAQRTADAAQAQFQQLMTLMTTQNANKGPDPMIGMLMEQARLQADVQKEIARENRAGLEKMQALIMPPRELVLMMKEASSGSDQVTRQVTDAMSNVLGFQTRAMEQAMSMNQTGGKTVVDIVDGALEKASNLAEKYALAKSHEARAASQAQAQVAQAQAHAVSAQAQANIVATRAAAGIAEPAAAVKPAVVPPPPKPAPGLNGTATNGNVPGERKLMGRTDAEWFTPPAMPEVTALRAGVSMLIESLKMTPPRMTKDGTKVEGVEAEQCAQWILQAFEFATQNKIIIPAITELLAEKRYSDFMDVLLPDAPSEYRYHVIQLIVPHIEGTVDDEEEEDDEDRSVGQAKPGDVDSEAQH